MRCSESQKIELTDHPPYSPDFEPKNFYLLPRLKNKLCGQCFLSRKVAVDAFAMHVLEIPPLKLKKCYKNDFSNVTDFLKQLTFEVSALVGVYFQADFKSAEQRVDDFLGNLLLLLFRSFPEVIYQGKDILVPVVENIVALALDSCTEPLQVLPVLEDVDNELACCTVFKAAARVGIVPTSIYRAAPKLRSPPRRRPGPPPPAPAPRRLPAPAALCQVAHFEVFLLSWENSTPSIAYLRDELSNKASEARSKTYEMPVDLDWRSEPDVAVRRSVASSARACGLRPRYNPSSSDA
ncbi:hypothetical protein EVAR_57241_1 [Eumeta japonica]|uniref:Histone-lysine N-methyltransferase SETMAR n=1 Tax=Eumeta variegata TaxID=151549 RepID=A0A4C1ZJC9_EUMVA|nr:hypothetical protein EVAR_57241_1 [Eumeta japonica]